MERLHALDAEFLHLEDGISHMHIGGVSVFDGSPPAEEAVLELLASKLDRIPRYRQRVRSVPLELGRPVWVDDPHFDLAYHVRSTALVEPGDDAAVCRLVGRIMSQELDRNRPLWEAWIVHGLPHGHWALLSKVHHCMVDGIAGVGLLEALLDVAPDAERVEPEPWTPTPEPSGPAMVLDAWAGAIGDLVGRVERVPALISHPADTARSLGETTLGLVRFGQRLGSTSPLSVEGTIGPHRTWAHSLASLDDVRLIRKGLGGTVNDVVLAAVSHGFRQVLLANGDDVANAQLRTLVPVSVRSADAGDEGGNRVAALLYELPVGIADPVERLEQVRTQMAELKVSHMPEASNALVSVADLAPPMFMGTASRAVMWYLRDRPQRSVNSVMTNVPGPQFPLYCLGREMIEYLPYVPISHGVRIGTAVLSYNGWLCFGVTGDRSTSDDVDILARGITAGIEELVAASR
jgi:diacylglycerol O-acyltransferase